MVVVTTTVHPSGLTPMECAKAWYLHHEEDKSYSELQGLCVTVAGHTPGKKALRLALARVGA